MMACLCALPPTQASMLRAGRWACQFDLISVVYNHLHWA